MNQFPDIGRLFLTTNEETMTELKKQIIPELLSLKDLQNFYNLSPATIKRERWEQKAVKQNKIKPEEVRNLNGFGYNVDCVPMYRKLYYKKDDVEAFINSHIEKAPSKLLADDEKN